jgi:hypothetical protein
LATHNGSIGDLYIWRNQFGADTSDELDEEDFDCDKVTDLFQATGATWWYSSGDEMEWLYF